MYNKNWFSNFQLTSLAKLEKNSNDAERRYMIIRDNVSSLLATANLEKKKRRKIYRELKKDIQSFKKL
jgi:hypothetical protein